MLHEEERCADVYAKEAIEILDRVVLDRRRPGDAGIGDKNVQPIAHDRTNLLGELVRPVGRGEIGGDGIGAAAGLADLSDDGFRRLRAASVVDEHLGAGLGERQCAGPPDAARGAGDESRFS